MSALRIASRYAKALFQIAAGNVDSAEKTFTALQSVNELFKIESAAKVLRSPVMPNDLKRSLVDLALSKSGADSHLTNFTDTLTSAGRLGLFPEVVQAYEALLNEAKGILQAEVTAAVELGQTELDSVKASLRGLLGRDVRVVQKVDPSILGGFVVRIGNMLIDMSVKTKLNGLANSALA